MGSSVQKAFIRSRANRAEDQNRSQKAKFKPLKSPAARLPDFVEPMKAKLVDSMPVGGWIYEIKFDGYRALVLRGGSETRILSRNEKDLVNKFPEVKDRGNILALC